MSRLLAASAGLALALSLSACGAGEDTQAAEAISTEFQSGAAGAPGLDKKDADCVAKGIVDEIGVEKLKESGLLTEDLAADTTAGDLKLPQGDADKAAAVMGDCTDLFDLVLDESVAGIDEEAAACIRDNVKEADIEQLLAATFAGEEPDGTDAITQAATECLTPS